MNIQLTYQRIFSIISVNIRYRISEQSVKPSVKAQWTIRLWSWSRVSRRTWAPFQCACLTSAQMWTFQSSRPPPEFTSRCARTNKTVSNRKSGVLFVIFRYSFFYLFKPCVWVFNVNIHLLLPHVCCLLFSLSTAYSTYCSLLDYILEPYYYRGT